MIRRCIHVHCHLALQLTILRPLLATALVRHEGKGVVHDECHARYILLHTELLAFLELPRVVGFAHAIAIIVKPATIVRARRHLRVRESATAAVSAIAPCEESTASFAVERMTRVNISNRHRPAAANTAQMVVSCNLQHCCQTE